MKHVFVETNFLVELLRPSPAKDAEQLFARNDGVDLRLYVPWCSQSEVWRTLSDRIIREDLGFTDAMMKFALRRWLTDRTLFDKGEIEKLRDLANADRATALSTQNSAFRRPSRRWSGSTHRRLSLRERSRSSP
jgi:predicted nucleic acid-binding protein